MRPGDKGTGRPGETDLSPGLLVSWSRFLCGSPRLTVGSGPFAVMATKLLGIGGGRRLEVKAARSDTAVASIEASPAISPMMAGSTSGNAGRPMPEVVLPWATLV